MKIFVVDDSETMRLILKAYLHKLAPTAQIFEFSNVQFALNAFHDENPDVIITDYAMPYFDGLHLCEKIKSLKKETVVVCVTGLSFDNFRRKYIESVFDFVLYKPVFKNDINSMLINLIYKNKIK